MVTMLPSGEFVRDVALGPNGLIEGFKGGELLIDTSSCEPWITVATAQAASTYANSSAKTSKPSSCVHCCWLARSRPLKRLSLLPTLTHFVIRLSVAKAPRSEAQTRYAHALELPGL
ncbi:MAG: NAD(P)-binding domain-containing protein, partial [Schleiferiaceae bacterium]